MKRKMVAAAIVLCAGYILTVNAQEPPAPSPAVRPAFQDIGESTDYLDDLQWLGGTWIRSQGSDYVEEVWSQPHGNSLAGIFRWFREGKIWHMEMRSITAEGGHLVLRVRHFDGQFKAHEDAPLVYTLKSSSEREVVFENAELNKLRRITFAAPDDNTFVANIQGAGEPTGTNEFRYRRR